MDMVRNANSVEGTSEKPARLMSLDALRGADMLFIMGFARMVVALCAVLGFKGCWLAVQMTHVPWEGFHHHDTIFPLFLFLAGVSWPFSLAAQRAKGRTTGQIVRKIFLRAVTLVFLGLAVGALFTFDVSRYRYDSVLAHIGVCWAGAALLALFVRSWRWRLAAAFALMIGYWLLVYLIPAPDVEAVLASTDPAVMKKVAQYAALGTGPFTPIGSFACWFDRMFCPGVLYETIFNADGLLGKLTGVALAIFGTLAGELLREKTLSGNRKTLLLLLAAAASGLLLLVWQPVCPIIKKIWTPTFVLASATYALTVLALFYWTIDVKGWRGWSFFFRVIGMNSITIYLLQHFINFQSASERLLSGVMGLGNADWAQFVSLLGRVAIAWLVLWYFYRNKTFLKV